MLHNINTAIDSFQSVKTTFVDTFVENEQLKKPLHTFIEAQTTFAKNVAKSASDFYTTVGTSAALFDVKNLFDKAK
jgi:hypothetical protein